MQPETVKLIHQVRGIFEELKSEGLPSVYEGFPEGCCGDVSILLVKVLQENGLPLEKNEVNTLKCTGFVYA